MQVGKLRIRGTYEPHEKFPNDHNHPLTKWHLWLHRTVVINPYYRQVSPPCISSCFGGMTDFTGSPLLRTNLKWEPSDTGWYSTGTKIAETSPSVEYHSNTYHISLLWAGVNLNGRIYPQDIYRITWPYKIIGFAVNWTVFQWFQLLSL